MTYTSVWYVRKLVQVRRGQDWSHMWMKRNTGEGANSFNSLFMKKQLNHYQFDCIDIVNCLILQQLFIIKPRSA